MFALITAENGVKYLRSDMLRSRHGFSTRIGGIIDLTDKGVQFDDGMLEILLIRQAPTVQAILDFREQRYDPNYFYLLHAAEATFRFEQPVNWSCDGESAGPFTEVTFRILPRAVNLLY